jgi:hypothetical protein
MPQWSRETKPNVFIGVPHYCGEKMYAGVNRLSADPEGEILEGVAAAI